MKAVNSSAKRPSGRSSSNSGNDSRPSRLSTTGGTNGNALMPRSGIQGRQQSGVSVTPGRRTSTTARASLARGMGSLW